VTTGIDFWYDDIQFQDLRFNCYASLTESKDGGKEDTLSKEKSGYMSHKNILPGHASIIQNKSSISQGGLLILVSKNSDSADTPINFFEGSNPKGILLQNYQATPELNVTNIGLGTLTDPNTRVKIRGRTGDSTMNALKIVNGYNSTLLVTRNDGKTGIGTNSPEEKLHVNGNVKIGGDLNITGKINFPGYAIGNWRMTEDYGLKTEGRVTIGPDSLKTDSPYYDDYSLSVSGIIVTTELVVSDSSTEWYDIVFDENYELTPLEVLEQKIMKNKHLPGIPTAKEIQTNGIKIGEMQAKLLQKIEELTLYVIDLKKENIRMQNQIDTLTK